MARLILTLCAAVAAVVLVVFFVLSVIHVVFLLGMLVVIVLLGVGVFRIGRWSGRGSRQETWK
jgi:hypothetical protein